MNWYLPDSSSDWTTVWKRVFHPVPHLNLMPPFQREGLSPSLLLHFYQMCFARWNIISEEGTCDYFCQSKGMSAVSNSNSLIDQKKTKQNTLTVTRMVSGHLSVRTVEKVIFSATFKQVFFTNQKGSENVSLKLSPNYFWHTWYYWIYHTAFL